MLKISTVGENEQFVTVILNNIKTMKRIGTDDYVGFLFNSIFRKLIKSSEYIDKIFKNSNTNDLSLGYGGLFTFSALLANTNHVAWSILGNHALVAMPLVVIPALTCWHSIHLHFVGAPQG